MKKRMLALLLALCMVLSLVPVMGTVSAAEFSKEEYAAQARQTPNKLLSSSGDEADTANVLEYGYIRNEYIEAYINETGNYTMGTVEGDPNTDSDDYQLLLFGHPGSTTTETLFLIDGYEYYFDDYVTSVELTSDTSCVATAEIDGLVIQQILTIETNPYTDLEDVISIRYTYQNNTTSSKQVGVRIMLDTMLGDNDGAPFRVNGRDVTYECEFSGDSVPQYWQSFDNLTEPSVTSTGFFYYDTAEKPDKVQFAYWGSIVGSTWDYAVSSDTSITGDSAVAAYFNPRTVAARGSNSIVTYYGVSGFSDSNTDLEGELGVRITAPSALTASASGGYANNPFDISVYLTNYTDETMFDVTAVLTLDDTSRLVLDDSQASTVSVGTLASGAERNLNWTLRAVPQTTACTTSYSLRFYSGSELLKVMDLTLDLAALAEKDSYRTVTFNLNGASGTAPAAQRVKIGDYAVEPDAPIRDGYTFLGWYANKNGVGNEWFNVYTNYKGYAIEENMTLYAVWESASGELVYGIDTYNFINTDSSFYSGATGTYVLTGDYYDILMSGLDYDEQQSVQRVLNQVWGGSCFGMSATISLFKANRLDVDYFQSSADCVHDLTRPANNVTIGNLINYYHAMQMTNITGWARSDYDRSNETANNRAIIEALDASIYPVVVGFNILQNGSRIGGHAVVAYGYTTDSNGYNVMIWDPNDNENPLTLYISRDFSTSYFSDTYDDGSWTSYMKYALTVESELYDYKNIQEELIELGYGSGAGANAVLYADGSDDSYALITNYGSFTISDGTSSAVIEDGVLTSGELSITDADMLNEPGSDLIMLYVLPALADGAAYTITVTDAGLETYQTTLQSGDSATGFYANVATAAAGTISISADGTVNTSFDAAVDQSVSVTSNAADASWHTVNTESVTTGLTMSNNADGANVTTDDAADVALSLENAYNSVNFDTVSTGESGVSIAEDAEGTTVVTDNAGASILTSAQMGSALIFYSMGGTSIEAQTDLPYGTTASEPEAPVRPGFIFDGWYTTAECNDGEEWSFSNLITEDIRIYAKWLVDNEYSHTVTFKVEGYDDIVFVVRNGEGLDESEIPAVPERQGCTGQWDISDFSNITSDTTVYAIYTRIAHLTRISGEGRCETAIEVANTMLEILGADKFDTIIIANGNNFADALAGSYLAVQKNAPILLYRANAVELNLSYIQENLSEDGIVYLLGGTTAVPADVEDGLEEAGIEVKRLAGPNRFDTNLEILREAGIGAGEEILIATGYNFADSLSASATGRPILMVNNTTGKLTDSQIEFLDSLSGCTFTIIGGTSAVSDSLENALSRYGDVNRLAGSSREATSVLVARTFFNDPERIVMAYSRNFPDGLCGGPLAYLLGSPLILVNAGQESAAYDYVEDNLIYYATILGGTDVLSDETVQTVFGLN